MGSLVLAGASSGSTTITPTDAVTATVTLPSTGGTVQTSGSGYTANGVAYASSTSALATGSALTFDGTNLGLSGTGSRFINMGSTSTNGPSVALQISAPNSNASESVYRIGGGLTADNELVSYDVTNGQLVDKYIRGSSGFRAFWTNGSERMRIDSSGNLLVGTTSQIGSTAAREVIKFDNNNFYGLALGGSAVGSAGIMNFYNSAGTEQGYISTNGSGSTTYSTSSDYRLKENIAPMTGALAKVAQLKPVTYTWKEDGSSGQGFIAHELQAIVPDCVTREKDAVDADGNPKYQGIDTSFLVATLTSAIQELSTLITAQSATIQSLTERITALEGART